MVSTVYLAALEPDTGKSVIALGMMEVLAARTDRVGFFRPILGDGPDPLVELMVQRYGVRAEPQGVTYAQAQHLTPDELVSTVVERFRALARDCDAVLCVGSDFTDVSAATEFALNRRLAGNLGAGVLAVVSGRGKNAAEVVAAIRFARAELAESAVVGVVANRVDPDAVEEVRAATDAYVVPYAAVLVEPTVGEVAAQTGARVLVGDSEELDRDVRAVVVAAATLPTVLDHLTEGALVLTPGDRSEIVLGMLAAAVSPNAPHVSGLLLTTGLVPDPRVQRVLDGLAPHTPVLAVETDTFTTAQAVGRVQGQLSGRKIPAALGLVERHVDFVELARRVEVTRSARVTPLMFEYDLVERARADRRHIVLPEGTDDRVLRATEVLLRRGVAAITLLGPVAQVRTRAAALGLDIEAATVLDPLASPDLRERLAARYAQVRAPKGVTLEQARDIVTDVSYFGTLMVAEGLADGMVSGAAHTTAHTIRPAFEVVKTVPGVRTVSSVFFMCLADRVLVYGDCAIIPDPTADQLADIAVSSAATARQFGVEPRVAMLSYSTGTSGSGADVDKVRAATALVRERAPELPVEGPIQYDAAVDASVAAAKLPGSAVAGQATVFVFPDLSSGNNTYKAVQRTAGAVAVGPVLQGLRRPVNDLSRGCTVADIINTVAITAIQSMQQPG
ncbi:MAG TPA: phosphate acetyltransferase [Mycobacteriales bacterium]|nr:phosphate acetyltransferase [Mycobacteriales bacterium]